MLEMLKGHLTHKIFCKKFSTYPMNKYGYFVYFFPLCTLWNCNQVFSEQELLHLFSFIHNCYKLKAELQKLMFKAVYYVCITQ